MIIVADTSPLNILVLIDRIELLPRLFEDIAIPRIVADELANAASSEVVRSWIASRPPWLSIREPSSLLNLDDLDKGEVHAISLASELNAAILIDEKEGRSAAASLGLMIIGTIGLLERAANQGFIDDLAEVHQEIHTTNFYISEQLLEQFLNRHLTFRQSQPE